MLHCQLSLVLRVVLIVQKTGKVAQYCTQIDLTLCGFNVFPMQEKRIEIFTKKLHGDDVVLYLYIPHCLCCFCVCARISSWVQVRE